MAPKTAMALKTTTIMTTQREHKAGAVRARRILQALLGLLAMLFCTVPQIGQASSPQGTVERLNAVFVTAKQTAGQPGASGRAARLSTDLREIFDYWLMAKAAVGPIWQRLDRGQRDALVAAFTEFNIAAYTARFAQAHDEAFEVVGIEQGKRGTVLVRSEIRRADGGKFEQAYLTRAYNGRWRVVDVLVDGKFSQLAVTRSEYRSVIKYHGFEQLLRLLRQKTQELHDS